MNVLYRHAAFVAVDRPAVTRDVVDTLGVAEHIVDVHGQHRVVGIDIDIVRSIRRNGERIAAASFEFPFTLLFLKADEIVVTIRAYHDGVVFLVGLVTIFAVAANEGDTESVRFVGGGNCHGDMIVVVQCIEHHTAVRFHRIAAFRLREIAFLFAPSLDSFEGSGKVVFGIWRGLPALRRCKAYHPRAA